MTDYFALLGEPRRPWLDEAALKAKFHALTAAHHPDVAGEASPDFSAINVAYRALGDPRARLRHLLELEAPELVARHLPAPAAIGELFSTMGARKLALDLYLKQRAAAGSALSKAMLMPEQFRLQEELEAWLAVLEGEKGRWLEGIPALDAAWMADPVAAAPRVAETAQALGYLEKWGAQIREGLVQLQIG